MGFAQPKAMLANGTIIRARFVKLDSTVNHAVIQAGTNDPIIGIAGDEARTAPTPDVGIDPYQAAQAGEMIDVHPNTSECLLEAGGTWLAGDRLTSDTNGKGVKNPKTGHPPRIGAIALTGASSGELGLVQVCIFDSVATAFT